jgi:hypothetical protein
MYRRGLTPRRTVPPSEVAVAVEMHRAAERSKASTPTHDTVSAVSVTKQTPGPLTLSGVDDNGPPFGNGYSLGSSLPRGTSWRYVDILNSKEDV